MEFNIGAITSIGSKFGSKIFGKKDEDLQAIGIDTQKIDEDVQSKIQQNKAKTYSKQEFSNDVKKIMSDNNIDFDTAYNEAIKYYNKKGYKVDGLDINKEINISQPQSTTLKPQETTKPTVGGVIKDLAFQVNDPLGFNRAAISHLNEVAGNIAGFTVDIFTPKEKEGLGDILRAKGIESKEQMQDLLNVDSEAKATKAAEFITEIGLTMLPTPAGKLSVPGKVKNAFGGAIELINKYPKARNVLQSAGIGMKEVGKYQVISEGEVTKGNLAAGAVIGPLSDKIIKTLKTPTVKEAIAKINERFGKLSKSLSPIRTTKAVIDKEINKGTQGAFIIREMNPDIKMVGDDAVSNILDASKNTRHKIYKDIGTARGTGIIENKNTVKWMNDMIEVLENPSKLKNYAYDPNFIKQHKTLFNIPETTKVVNSLKNERDALISKGDLTLSQWDDQIVSRNKRLKNFFTQQGDEKISSEVGAAVADNMKKNLDDSIGAMGEQFRNLKKAYGNVKTFEKNINKIYVELLRKKDSQLGDYADTFILSNMGSNIVSGNFGGLGKDVLAKLIKEQIKKKNNPNFVLQQMFNLIDEQLGIKPFTTKEKIKRGVQSAAGATTGGATITKIGASELVEDINE